MEDLNKSMLNLTTKPKTTNTQKQSQQQQHCTEGNCKDNSSNNNSCKNISQLTNCLSTNNEINQKQANCSKKTKNHCQLIKNVACFEFSTKIITSSKITNKPNEFPGLRKSQSTPALIIRDAVDPQIQKIGTCNESNNDDDNDEINKLIQQQQYDQQQQCKIDPNLTFGCAHYKRRAMFVTPCCKKFYKCRFCHDENESHHFDRKTLTELICSDCKMRQKVQEQCEYCGIRFGKYTCLICNLFDDTDKQQYHCDECGICRMGGSENFFHCKRCDMCLPIQLQINGHRCVENISRSHCPVCLGDIHTSRIPCHIPDCGHLLHKMCFDQLLTSGHYTCPTCQTSLIDMSTLWDFLDAHALLTPMPKHHDNQTINIFCNDCHKTSITKYHFIGLKCNNCGAYNTTQDVKRRISLVRDEPNSA